MKRNPISELGQRQLRRLASSRSIVDTPNTSQHAPVNISSTSHSLPAKLSDLDTSNEDANLSISNTESSFQNLSSRPTNTLHETLGSNSNFQLSPNMVMSSDSDEDLEVNPDLNLQYSFHSPNSRDVESVSPIPPELFNSNLKNDLIQWAIKFNVSHKSLSELLKLLKNSGHPTLPSDARTLLHTPHNTDLKVLEPGFYWHNGLKNSLISELHSKKLDSIDCIELAINIDGLPLAKSSGSSLWPILGSIIPSGKVFIIGAYHGLSKPLSANSFLSDFVSEIKHLSQFGPKINDKTINVIIKYFICDAPAKAFILNVKGHGGYSSCTKCTVEGETVNNRVCFVDLNSPKRTDADFRMQIDEDYHCGTTVLSEIPNVGLVTNIPLDYMHLVCLGVTRKLIYLLIGGPLQVRLQSKKVKEISKKLDRLKFWVPKEFVRKPRSLTHVKQWKATEYRKFLLYTGLVVLKGVIPKKLYDNFMTLSVAIRILCTKKISSSLLDYSEQLLKVFVDSFRRLYGKHFVSHNVHGLIHLVDDVRHFGSLDQFSAFPFENFMQVLKKMVRKHEKPLQQISRRYQEAEINCPRAFPINKSQSFTMLSPHFEGPLLSSCGNPQSKKLTIQNSCFSTQSKGDNCCLIDDDSIVIIKNFATDICTGEPVVVGLKFQVKCDFFEKPCCSSFLQIYKCKSLSSVLKSWPARNISRKCFIMPLGNKEFAVVPLLHFE